MWALRLREDRPEAFPRSGGRYGPACLCAALLRSPTALVLSSAILVSGWTGAAFSQTVDPEAERDAPRFVGEQTGDPERNTFGYAALPSACPGPQVVFSPELRNVGPITGDPEKDSVGHIVLGERGCDARLAGRSGSQAGSNR